MDRDRSAEMTDRLLLQRFRDGEQDAATQLFLKYAARLQSLARSRTSTTLASRFDPEDVVQSVFRTFFRRAEQGLYDVPEGDELWQLLLVLALNKIRKLAAHHGAQKRDARKTSSVLEDVDSQTTSDQTPTEILQIIVEDFLSNLPESQAMVARLRMEGFEVREIAEKVGRSKRTTERILNELRKSLVASLPIDKSMQIEGE